jgi:hypothetical protein
VKIRTAYDPPADCGRSLYDWIAIDDESWDGERGPIGFGPTEDRGGARGTPSYRRIGSKTSGANFRRRPGAIFPLSWTGVCELATESGGLTNCKRSTGATKGALGFHLCPNKGHSPLPCAILCRL